MKIGIMGGTFDPIHNGHLMLGNYAYKLFRLDQVWFLPNGNPPHKSSAAIESMTVNRVEMVQKAIQPYAYFRLEKYEVEGKEISYSYRNGKGTQEMLSQIHYLARKYECDIRLMNTPDLEVSSSDIRKRIKEGLPISEFVPEAVEKYIAEKHLFEEEQNEAVDNT